MRKWFLLIGVTVLTACDRSPQWQGRVYPDRFNHTKQIEIGRFQTLEECRNAALLKVRELRRFPDDDVVIREYEPPGAYVCAYKCKLAGGPNRVNVCEKTLR